MIKKPIDLNQDWSELHDELGLVVFLEGDADAFNEYNVRNLNLKEIYDANNWKYMVIEDLYKKDDKEVMDIFIDILLLAKDQKVSFSLYTQNIQNRNKRFEELILFLLNNIKSVHSDIKSVDDLQFAYFIEQFSDHMRCIAEQLGAKHTDIEFENPKKRKKEMFADKPFCFVGPSI